ncbi:hypothetical protein FT122_23465 [Vibrio alginolyticus]|nr:hypothetical protein [Vibrio alginolyticus]
MGIGATLFWGAVSGVIATGFLWLCGIVLYKVLLPWYQEKVYKGVDLAGRWTYETEENGATYTYQIDLEQSAHNISGQVSLPSHNQMTTISKTSEFQVKLGRAI